MDYKYPEDQETVEQYHSFTLSFTPKDSVNEYDCTCLRVGYDNVNEEPATIEECSVSYFEIEVGDCYGDEEYMFNDDGTFNYIGIEKGMTYEEVKEILGKEESCYASGNDSEYDWYLSDTVSIEVDIAAGIGVYGITVYFYNY